jgi:hypothetical protein
MPAYANLLTFMARVNAANPTFERHKNSSLHSLIAVLSNPAGNAVQVINALAAIPISKTKKYKNALYYLVSNYPGVAPFHLNLGVAIPGNKANAAMFTQTALPPVYAPGPPAVQKVVALSAFLNQTVEQYLIANPGTGIVLIHLSQFQPNMNDLFDGARVVDHMKSALRVGLDNNADICVLYQMAPPVCPNLQAEVNAYPAARRTLALVHPQHMGMRDINFQAFVNNHPDIVVMGFNASVCVRANMFGAPEQMPAGGWVPPLVTRANLITSRAVLVTGGNIAPLGHQGEYGVLFNT